MSKYGGRRVKAEIGLEPVKGGGPAGTTTQFIVPRATLSVRNRRDKSVINAGLGYIEEAEEHVVGDKFVEGDISGEVRSVSFGVLLVNLFGAAPNSSGSNPTTHTFSLQQSNAPQTLYIKVHDPDKSELYRSVVINQLSISVPLSGPATFTASFMGKAGIPTTDTGLSLTAESIYTKNHLKFFLAADISGLSSASRLSLKQFDISFNRNAEADGSLGTAEPEEFLTKSLKIDGSYQLNLENQTFENYYMNDTARAARILFDFDSGNQLEFDIYKLKHNDWDPDRSLDEIVKQTLNFDVLFDTANTATFESVRLINSRSSYAA